MKPPDPSLEPSLKQILVVDDEDIVRIALRETLRRERYGVTACPSPEEALLALQKEAFSVIISDYQMPGMTGLDFLAKAKQIQPDATRILITAVLSLDTVIEAINKGEIYRFIVKPWIREELLATVRNAVQRHELIVRNTVLQATTLAMNEQLVSLNKALESRANAESEQRRRLAELNSALELNLHHSVQLCLKVLQSFHPALGTQARRVFGLCRAMADTLRLPDSDRQTLELSAWLHDIGLVGTPRGLIRKWLQQKEKLTPTEQSQIEQHPILGEELVDFVAHLQPVGRVIRGHHEQFDGRGTRIVSRARRSPGCHGCSPSRWPTPSCPHPTPKPSRTSPSGAGGASIPKPCVCCCVPCPTRRCRGRNARSPRRSWPRG